MNGIMNGALLQMLTETKTYPINTTYTIATGQHSIQWSAFNGDFIDLCTIKFNLDDTDVQAYIKQHPLGLCSLIDTISIVSSGNVIFEVTGLQLHIQQVKQYGNQIIFPLKPFIQLGSRLAMVTLQCKLQPIKRPSHTQGCLETYFPRVLARIITDYADIEEAVKYTINAKVGLLKPELRDKLARQQGVFTANFNQHTSFLLSKPTNHCSLGFVEPCLQLAIVFQRRNGRFYLIGDPPPVQTIKVEFDNMYIGPTAADDWLVTDKLLSNGQVGTSGDIAVYTMTFGNHQPSLYSNVDSLGLLLNKHKQNNDSILNFSRADIKLTVTGATTGSIMIVNSFGFRLIQQKSGFIYARFAH